MTPMTEHYDQRWDGWRPERLELLEMLPHPTSPEYAACLRRLWRRWEPERLTISVLTMRMITGE